MNGTLTLRIASCRPRFVQPVGVEGTIQAVIQAQFVFM